MTMMLKRMLDVPYHITTFIIYRLCQITEIQTIIINTEINELLDDVCENNNI